MGWLAGKGPLLDSGRKASDMDEESGLSKSLAALSGWVDVELAGDMLADEVGLLGSMVRFV